MLMSSQTTAEIPAPEEASDSIDLEKAEIVENPVSENIIPENKENSVNTSSFQQPSPLTSKRKKPIKSSPSRKILSPHRNNQWISSTRANRQPRSSPINRETSRRLQDQGHERQDMSQHPTNFNKDISYAIAGDIDMITNTKQDDDFSAPDILNLGTFDDDSPSKEPPKSYSHHHRRESPPPRASPRDSNYDERYYRASPSYSGHYDPYYSNESRNYYYSYHPPPRYSEQPWTSPQAYDYGSEQDHIPPPCREYDQGSMASPIRKKHRWDRDRTPERQGKSSKSPFRSPAPVQNIGSSKKFKRSPIWGGGGTPNIDTYGSFDTPGGMGCITDFSPMGPTFKNLPFEKESPQIPMEGEVRNLNDSLNQASETTPLPPMRRQRRNPYIRNESPGLNFMSKTTNIPSSMPIPSSPMRSSSRDPDYSRYYSDKERRNRTSYSSTKQPSHIFASPVATSQRGSNKRSPYYDSSRQHPGPYRLELGNMATPSERSGSLERINSMVRGSSHSSSAHSNYNAEPFRGHGYRADLSTPVKINQTGSRVPISRTHVTPYHPQSSNARSTPMSSANSRYPNPSPNLGHSAKTSRSTQSMKTPSTSKDKVVTPASSRRNPCNCKKSKCLKLYCECFAAELYCDGCNCNDCRNTKEYEDVRAKAMKDTRAKNPNAFKPRIAVRNNPGPTGCSPTSAHNMGCKCKRSECLKKYCECFQAGVMCGSKCKCVDCLNYVGSQALIDKRRKIKDHRGADFAMRIADEAWKKGKHGHPPSMSSSGKSRSRHHGPSPHGPSPSSAHPPHGSQYPPIHPHMMHPNPPQHGPPGSMYPPPMMMGHPHMGYSPMAMHPSTKPYTHGQKSAPPQRKRSSSAISQVTNQHRKERKNAESKIGVSSHGESKVAKSSEPESSTQSAKSNAKESERISATAMKLSEKIAAANTKSNVKDIEKTPAAATKSNKSEATKNSGESSPNSNSDVAVVTPKTVCKKESIIGNRVRLGYDPASSKKKRKLSLGEKEETFSYFGKLPDQPKTTALNIFSFLSNDEIYNAGLVCKKWNRLAMDEELWQF